MLWFLMFSSIVFLSTEALPHHRVEVEKLRLVKFPEESFHYQARETSDETRRILEEINKINERLGYVKKQEHRSPAHLDSNTYLYPQSTYHPSHYHYSSGGSHPSSIRTSNPERLFVPRKIMNSFSFIIPQIRDILDGSNYGNPAPYLRVSLNKKPNKFSSSDSKLSLENTKENAAQSAVPFNSNLPVVFDYSQNIDKPHQVKTQEFDRQLLRKLKKIIAEETETEKAKVKIEAFKKNEDIANFPNARAHNISQLNSPFSLKNPDSKLKKVSTKPMNAAERSPTAFLKPLLRPISTTTTTTTTTEKPINSNSESWSEYDSSESGEDQEEENEKYIFSSSPIVAKDEAIKKGGIVIQRLKVRKGGIAIAGPGGVATAGSGGTAIVGPGGLALTHPKGLTIAGPGAKIIALPASFDLDKAVLKSSARLLPQEGRLVATGPTIYYHPEEDYSDHTKY